jgi:hypothetical protein
MGPIKEEFVANGAPYNTVDGHKQTLECVPWPWAYGERPNHNPLFLDGSFAGDIGDC